MQILSTAMDSLVFRLMCLVCVGTQIVPGTNAGFSEFSTPASQSVVTYISALATQNALKEKAFVFSVKACRDAFVHLTDALNADLNNKLYYQFVLGGWGNTKTDLREKNKCQAGYGCDYFDPSVERTDHTTSPLDCNAFKSFWVSWENGIIIGSGNVVGQEAFLTWAGPMRDEFTLSNIAVSSATPADWIIPQGYIEMSTTGREYDVTFLKADVMATYSASEAIVFNVKVCMDAFIHLTNTDGDLKSALHYQLVIGGWTNSKTDLRECPAGDGCGYYDTSVERVDNSHPPLDCDAFNAFWVSWAGNCIYVGYGTVVGQDTFLTWAGPLNQVIQYAAISTIKPEDPGAWIIQY